MSQPTPSESPLKITMQSLRLTGDQCQRILEIHRNKAVECYEHWDWKLRNYGLVAIGPIPPEMKRAKEKWIAGAWVKVRNMAGVKVPTAAKIREMEGLLNQMHWAAHGIEKKYSTLTAAGIALATNGRAVILPSDTPKERQ